MPAERFDIACVGEGMIELSLAPNGWTAGYGGDVLNTAIHLARAGCRSALFTALGDDGTSAELRRRWSAEGVDCSLIASHPTRGPGLYAIACDEQGERSFTYWRDRSAAREMFAISDAAAAEATRLLYFSLISLAILPEEGRTALLALARRVKEKGGRVVFDGNYRPRLWESAAEAVRWGDRAIAIADIGLPTLDDEQHRCSASDADAVAACWTALGCGEVIVKLGATGCRLPDGSILAPARALRPVDSSGAGDAFNAGYIAAMLHGAEPRTCAEAGHRLAGEVVMRHGAIPAVPPEIYRALR